MPSNPSAAKLDDIWSIIQHYPELHWSKQSLLETLQSPNTIAFSTPCHSRDLCRQSFATAQGGNPVSVALFSKVLDEAELLLIATDPKHLKQGHAKALLQSSILSLHVKAIFLELRASNVAAHKLYKTLGFKQISLRKNYYHNPSENALILKKLF